MIIRKLQPDEPFPMELLLLADESLELVEEYIQRGQCFVAEADHIIIGEYVLLPTRPATVELVNIAVNESWQGRGIGKQLVNHAVQHARILGYQTIEIGPEIPGSDNWLCIRNAAFEWSALTGISMSVTMRKKSMRTAYN